MVLKVLKRVQVVSKKLITEYLLGFLGFIILLTIYSGWGIDFLIWINHFDLVKSILNPNTSLLFTISFICFSIIVISLEYWYFCKRNGKISTSTIVLLLFILVLWFDCRFIRTDWIFTRFQAVPYLAYLDIIAVIAFCPFAYIGINAVKNLMSKDDNTETDEQRFGPITEDDEDQLDRKEFARKLAKHIIDLNAKDSPVSIAIVAPWGSGKTSFINLLKNRWKIAPQNHYVFDFSPWLYSDGTNLTRAFFEQLITLVNPINARLSKILRQYLTVLSETGYDNIFSVNKFIVVPNDSLKRLYNQVYRELQNYGKKFIIVIDDIDRLEAPELLEIFKIIRGSADFPNLKFVCAFDKSYVLSSLSSLSIAINDKYLEKFFELEYWLPSYDDKKIRDIIIKQCAKFLNKTDFDRFSEYLSPKRKRVFGRSMNPIDDGITNLRIASRWMNAIKFSYDDIRSEVLITDLADLELLKIISPSLYELFRLKWQLFTQNDSGAIKLWKENKSPKGREEEFVESLFREEKLNLFETDIFKSLNDTQRKTIMSIFSRILPEYGAGKSYSFSNAAYTERYFFQKLQDSEISTEDFKKIMLLSYDEFRQELQKKEYSTKTRWLSILINKYTPDSVEEACEYIKKVFFVGQRMSDSLVVDPHDFFYKLSKFPSNTDTIKKCIDAIIEEHRGSMSNLLFLNSTERSCPENLYSKYFDDNFPVNEALRIMHFAVEDNSSLEDVSKCFWSATKYKYERDNGRSVEKPIYNEVAINLYRAYWEKNIDVLHLKLIELINPTDTEKRYRVTSLAYTLWGDDLNDLIKILSDKSDNPSIAKTLAFIKESLKDNNSGITFTFES